MNNYRICKNAHDYYKIQMWHKPFKLFGKTIFEGSWEDCGFRGFSHNCEKFKTKEEAERVIHLLMERELRNNDDWVCSETEVDI